MLPTELEQELRDSLAQGEIAGALKHAVPDATVRQCLRAAAVAIRLLQDDWLDLMRFIAANAIHSDSFGEGLDLIRCLTDVQTKRLAQGQVAIHAVLDALAGKAPEDVLRAKALREEYRKRKVLAFAKEGA